jgi:ADP-ribose pyrophosphatase YjhB (NUDIX family)
MQHIHPEVVQVFGNKVRIRVCGILIKDDTILLVNHQGLNTANRFWSPPGGGIEFGESAAESLRREFREETGLGIEVVRFLCIHEHIDNSLQAIELFFEVKSTSGSIFTGTDPELTEPIIREVKFMTFEELQQHNPAEVHHLFAYCKHPPDISNLQGRFLTSH